MGGMAEASLEPPNVVPEAGAAEGGFYAGLPVFDRFEQLTDGRIYTPLPDGWVLGLSDIVRSTAAIDAGRYKVVNTAAAAVIAAVANALPESDFPFVFGGDGASFALPPEQAERGRAALSSAAAWVRDELDLTMRVALVPLGAVRAERLDVRIARFAPSPDVSYAMFTGGGLAWAEQRMKQGDYTVEPGPAGARPDLTGLSCRFAEIGAERGVILSISSCRRAGRTPDVSRSSCRRSSRLPRAWRSAARSRRRARGRSGHRRASRSKRGLPR